MNLSYIQAQYDYLMGNYPVVQEDAAQLCALQMQAEYGSSLMDSEDEVAIAIEKYIAKQVGHFLCRIWIVLFSSVADQRQSGNNSTA